MFSSGPSANYDTTSVTLRTYKIFNRAQTGEGACVSPGALPQFILTCGNEFVSFWYKIVVK